MNMPRRPLLALAALASNAAAQCLDWAPGFGAPNQGLDGAVYSSVVFDEDGAGPLPPALFVGGFFTTAGGIPARGVARWNGTSWSSLGGGFGGVTALAVYDDGSGPSLYAAGQFTVGSGAPSDYIARWNGTTWVGVGGGLGNNATSMTVYDDGFGSLLYVGGPPSAGGAPTDGLAAWDGVHWRTFSGGPGVRTLHGMAFDAARGNTVLFGGTTNGGGNGGHLGDTWTWDGVAWSRAATSGPSARYSTMMTFDSLRSRVILYGGRTPGAGTSSQTWSWDGTVWTQIASAGVAGNRLTSSIAYDVARDRVVLFGGQSPTGNQFQFNDTWEFNGTAWSQISVTSPPPARADFGMAFDAQRQRTVVFGGYNGNLGVLSDTWEWDGATWALRATTGPSARTAAGAMDYDTAHHRVLLFGGSGTPSPMTDTWAWDGAVWTQLAPAIPGAPNRLGPLAYDSVRDRFVQRTNAAATWLWDGAAWSPALGGGLVGGSVLALATLNTPNGPELFVGGSFTTAGGLASPRAARLTASGWQAAPGLTGSAVVSLAPYNAGSGPSMFAGGSFNASGIPTSVARWTGSAWEIPGSASPQGMIYAMTTFDDGSGPNLYVSGHDVRVGSMPLAGVAAWNGSQWRVPGGSMPPPRSAAAVAYDSARGRTVLFGGLSAAHTLMGDTWEWDGHAWNPVASGGPSPRQGAAMAYDAVRQRTVLIGGGANALSADAQTWTWDGAQWTLAAAGFGGGSLFGHGAAFDTDRGRLVVFGGLDSAGGRLGDTWEWDGGAWALTASTGPEARSFHAMTYDSARHHTVLYGGRLADDSTLSAETWQWDGAAWTLANMQTGTPGPRQQLSSVYDSLLGRVVLLGGINADGDFRPDTWEWNGTTWTFVYDQGPGIHAAYAMAYEQSLQRVLLFGGALPNQGTLGDFWVRSSTNPSWRSPGDGITGAQATAFTLATFGQSLYVAGNFTTVGGTPASNIARWGVPCSAPVISQQPVSQTAAWSPPPSFSVVATGTGPLVYQWRKNGQPLADGTHFQGTHTPTLSFNWSAYGDEGTYDVAITNPVGSVTSDPATLEVPVPGSGLPVSVIPVLYPPEPVPGMPAGNNFLDFLGPQMDPQEDIAVLAAINGNLSAVGVPCIVLSRNSTLELVASRGDPAPGTPAGVNFGSMNGANGVGEPIIGPGGSITFKGEVIGPGTSGSAGSGVWYRDQAGFDLVVRGGSQAPGLLTGVFFTSELRPLGKLSEGGLYVRADASGPPGSASGIWSWERGPGLSPLLTTGQTMPGTNATLTHITSVPWMNSSGSVLFVGGLSDGTYQLWAGPPSNLHVILHSGAQAPGMPAGNTIVSLSESRMILGEGGHAVFQTYLNNSRWALYRWDGASISPIILPGQQAPGAAQGSTFWTADPISINSYGDVLFLGQLTNVESGPTSGLWLADSAGITPIMLNNSGPPPGAPPNLPFQAGGVPAAINDLGEIVAQGGFYNGTGYSGVFGWTAATGLFPIALPGTQLEVRSGVYRTVEIGSFPAAIHSGNSGNLNNAGAITMDISFTDGSRGVFFGRFGGFASGFLPCAHVLSPPRPASVYAGSPVTLTAAGSGTDPLSYQWRRNGSNLTDGGRISGSHTPALTINPTNSADAGSYDVVITNSCGPATSLPATLTILCYTNCDNSTAPPVLNVLDFSCFLNRFAARDTYANCDGNTTPPTLNVLDFSCFLNRFAAGCP